MKIAVASGFHELHNGTDQWLTARTEGRAMINAGFGLSLLGHEVDIYGTEMTTHENVWPNVNLYSIDVLSRKKHEFLIAWDPETGKINKISYQKLILATCNPLGLKMEDFPLEKIKKDFPGIVAICTPIDRWKDRLPKNTIIPFEVMPILYPIPCYEKLTKQDFQDCTFDKNKKNIKVWVHISAWNPTNPLTAHCCMYKVLSTLSDRMGYEINLSLHLNSLSEASTPGPIKDMYDKFHPRLVRNCTLNHHDLLDEIYNSDICMTYGDYHQGARCSQDMVSLGKPMIYIISSQKCEEEDSRDTAWSEIFLDQYDRCIHSYADDEETIFKKLSIIMNDPSTHTKLMQDCYRPRSFPVWSKAMTALLNKYS